MGTQLLLTQRVSLGKTEFEFYKGASPQVLWAWGLVTFKNGDNVTVEMTPYDLTKGRITYRHK